MSGRTGVVQHYRTITPNTPPPSLALADGELGIEQAVPMKLWVGVPTSMDATGRKLLYDASAISGVGEFLPLAGGTMVGYITLVGDATLDLHSVPLQQMEAADALLRRDIDLLAQDLFFVGAMNVPLDQGTYTVASGLVTGTPLPVAAAANKGFYVIVTTGGAPPVASNIPQDPDGYEQHDWIVSDGTAWFHLSMGVATYVASDIAILPAIGTLGPNVQTGLEWLYANKVNLAGDVMTGFLTLHAAPVNAFHAATKKYVDDLAAAGTAGVVSWGPEGLPGRSGVVTMTPTDVDQVTGVLKSGATLTGYISAHLNATAPMHLLPLQQMTAAVDLLQQQIDLLAEDLFFVGGMNVPLDQGNYTIASGVPDGTPLPAPVPQYKGFYLIVTNGGVPPAGSNIPPGDYKPADWIITDGAQWIHLAMGLETVTAPMVAMLPVIGAMGANVQTSLQWLWDNKVDLAGDTMTGFLGLHADPVQPQHASTKRYVDSKVTVVDNISIIGTGATGSPLHVGTVNGGSW